MKTFYCDGCGGILFFENVQCLNCGHRLGFLPDVLTLSAVEPAGEQQFRALAAAARGRIYRHCANQLQHGICNWLVPADDPEGFCASCRLNLVVPNLSQDGNLKRWHKIELAKHRVLYALFRLGLPTEGTSGNRRPLRFKFLNDEWNGIPILTGHNGGEITLNVAEADADERERRRVGLREPYRTLVGHFRHEVAHYYWDCLVAGGPNYDAFRRLFGDETRDYVTALQSYYQAGPPADWQNRFVSAYACSHPWEDWAETWAHYLHMVDTLEAAAGFGMTLQFPTARQTVAYSEPGKVVALNAPFDEIVKNWLPLTTAINSVNRAMGLTDLYPFVLLNDAVEKMRFVHDVIRALQPAPVAGQNSRMDSVPAA